LNIQFDAFGGLLNLTSSSVVHAIPRPVTGTGSFPYINDNVSKNNNLEKKNKKLNKTIKF